MFPGHDLWKSRPGLVKLMDTHLFNDFKKRKPKAPTQFIWVVEKGVYESFKKQEFYNKHKRVYNKNSPLRSYFKDVQQMTFEVDMRRIYEFHHAQRKGKRVDMTSKNKVEQIEKAVKKLVLPSPSGACG